MLNWYHEFQKYSNAPPDLAWWQKEVVYQIYVRSFYDSNGDGTGDLQGITKKLDYLNHIGIKSVLLTPFYPSGNKDGGYDVTSLTAIDPVFGTMKDFDELVDKAHEKCMHVIMDFVPSHTSNQHDWFQKSCESNDSSNKYRDYYVWYESEDKVNPPNNWVSVFGGSMWTYNESRGAWYLHQFLKEQPDLNYRCPGVREDIEVALRFWLEDKKVDGFRLDALRHLFEDEALRDEPEILPGLERELKYDDLKHVYTTGQVETYELLREWRELFDGISRKSSSTKVLIVECYYSNVEELATYYRHNDQQMSHFPFNFQFIGFDKKNGNDLSSRELQRKIEDYLSAVPKNCWANWQLGNHDQSRVASRIGPENVNIANTLNLLLGGTPLVYYGEEIGMEDLPTNLLRFEDAKDEFGRKYGPNEFMNYSRDYARTPMQWSNSSQNSGFTVSKQPWLPINPNSRTRNVQVQLNDSGSHLNTTMTLLKLRTLPSFQWGKLKIHVVTDQVFSFTRRAFDFPSYLVVMNISDITVKVKLETTSEIAPRAYVSSYMPGLTREALKDNYLSKVYTPNASVLTKLVTLDARDTLILTWSG